MSQPPRNWWALAPRWRWVIWVTYVVVWTAILVMPTPDTGDWTVEELGIDFKYLIGKSLHVGAYAMLAMLTGWLQVSARRRWLLLFFIMAHGTVTELVQLHIPSRSGSLKDVGFDHLGIGLGLLVSWKWWSDPS
jgi:VanZ family protein